MGILRNIERSFNRNMLQLRLFIGQSMHKKRTKAMTHSHGNSQQHASARAFYAPYFKPTMIFHDFYYDNNGVWDDRYFPEDIYFRKLDCFYNHKWKAAALENKVYFKKMFSGIKQPGVFAYRLNNYWYNEKEEPVQLEDILKDAEKEKELIIKIAIGSCGGHGVFFINNEHGDLSQNARKIIEGIKEDILIQKPVIQSETLNQLSASSVNTIRFLTLLRKDEVKIYSALIRMGVNNARVDNSSSGGICCGISEDGRLKHYAYSEKGGRFETHPTSGIAFDSIVIPKYEEVKKTICNLAYQVPHFRMVSWDIAIDSEDDPVLIEANLAGGGVDIHQLCNGPLFGDDTKEILDEVFKKQN